MRNAGKTLWFLLAAVSGLLIWITAEIAPVAARPEPTPADLGPNAAQFSIILGVNDAEPTRWDGSVRASGARVTRIEGWRPVEGDTIAAESWKLRTGRVVTSRRGRAQKKDEVPVLETGIYLTAELLDAEANFEFTTSQGRFAFAAKDAGWGQTLSFLDGRVKVERVPPSRQLTSSAEEQDHPALAAAGDTVYLAYVEFTHGDRSQRWPNALREKPASFDALARPVGGDQVMLLEYSRSGRTWGSPQAVSAPRQDVYRATVAVDGKGALWVIWSAQVDGNFDIYARRRQDGSWSDIMRLTKDPGPDLNPAAVTASDGAVWVAWQGYRQSFDILAARQEGAAFSAEQRVSTSAANDWMPQIAAGPDGEVAIVWDTYDKGDYDVYLRRARRRGTVQMDPPLAVAASTNFEARPSAAYDKAGRIWVAYEEAAPKWGKDFGAYETTGTGLYQWHAARVKVIEGGSYFKTADDLDRIVSANPATLPVNRQERAHIPFVEMPDPQLAANRPAGATPYKWAERPSTGYPRIAAAGDGSIYLAYRTVGDRNWMPLGTIWFENVAHFDGNVWRGPIALPWSDGLLDNRPALAASDDGVLIVGTTDHRFAKSGDVEEPPVRDDDYNFDLVAYELRAPSAGDSPKLTAVAAERPAAASGGVGPEIEQVKLLRDYRVSLGNERLQVMRGEFHRHSSISGDGGNDGDIIDAFRYMLDAAYMDWVGCCDHDNGSGREYPWWITQKMTDAFHIGPKFVPMFSYERSVAYPEGHRNVILAQRGIRPLPRLPKTDPDSPSAPAPDTQMLYEYLRKFDGIAAVHTSGTNMGTDWRDNDPKVEPLVEIYQGDRQNYEIPGAPRSNTADDSIGGWRPLGFVSLALEKGYRLGFEASSDHISTHMSYANLWVTERTRQGLLEAFKKRRVYGATDNILADVRCAGHFMGEEFSLSEAPKIDVKLVGTSNFAKVHIVKDGQYVYTVEPGKREVRFSWRDNAAAKGTTSYYYVRGEQADGELVWVSPMWIRMM